jgi:FkbM family methyltransferase
VTTASVPSVSAITRLKQIVGPIIANPLTGRIAGWVFRNRIPHRGLTVDTSSHLVRDEIKAALLVHGYESSEYRFVRKYLPRDADVIELGGSLGIISCTICRHLDAAHRLVTVEADPRLAKILARNLGLNDCTAKAKIEGGAIYYGDGDRVEFGLGESSVAGRIGTHAQHLEKISVPALTLQSILSREGFTRYSIVSDIEGIEWQVLESDRAALLGAEIIVLETHDGPEGQPWSDLVARLRTDPEFEVLDQHGSVVVLRPRRAARAAA